jgi:hypothetical protein
MNKNSPSDYASPVCRKCHQPVEPQSEEELLDKFGGFVRLRCHGVECGHEDWYKEPVLVAAPRIAEPIPEGAGEVWIHDVILGLSFKAENGTSLDVAGRISDLN